MLNQPRPQGFSLKKWVGPHPVFEGKALGTRLMLNSNCRGCWQRSLPLPDLSRKIEGDTMIWQKKHKVKTLEIRITQIFWPVSRLDSAWNLKVRIQFSSIKKVVSGYLRVVVIFNLLLTHISKHLKIYIAWNWFTVLFNSNIKNPLVDIKLSAQAPIIVGIANHCANSRLNWIQVSLS